MDFVKGESPDFVVESVRADPPASASGMFGPLKEGVYSRSLQAVISVLCH